MSTGAPVARGSVALPPMLWEAPPLRGLDDRARGDLSLAAVRRDVAESAYLFRAGDPADHLYVIERGALIVTDRGGKTLRRAGPGDAVGEEALVLSFGARLSSARSEETTTVVALPASLLRRVWQRRGTAGHVAKLTRAMTRTAMRDALAGSPLGLNEDALDVLLDGARLLEVGRGDVILRPRETRRGLYVLLDGLVRLERSDGRVLAHLRGADVFLGGDVDRAAAAGPAWLIFVDDRTLRAAGVEETARKVAAACEASARAAHDALRSRDASLDLARLETGRSLLLFDGDACVRCGACASSCRDAHADGLSRLARHGPIVSLEGFPSAILPSSCEHCRAPACLPACPTGAIGRDERGVITLRGDLCTGCGSCAKACPWENLALAARPGGKGAEPGTSADVAVKCDLCEGVAEGPACVRACPTAAAVRIDGLASVAEVGAALRRPARDDSPAARPSRTRRHVLVHGAFAVAALTTSVAAFSLGAVGGRARLALGVVGLCGVFALSAYGAVKRSARVRRGLSLTTVPIATQYVVHLAVGLVTFGAVAGHARGGGRTTSLAEAALLALVVATTSGALGAVLFRVLPRRLSRLSRSEWLPEETRGRARSLAERVALELSGKSDLCKVVFARVLDPYRRSPITWLRLFVASTGIDDETARVRARIERALEGRGQDKLEGIDRLVDAVVEQTAFRIARVALVLLRAWVPLHVTAAAAALLLVILHAAAEVLFR